MRKQKFPFPFLFPYKWACFLQREYNIMGKMEEACAPAFVVEPSNKVDTSSSWMTLLGLAIRVRAMS